VTCKRYYKCIQLSQQISGTFWNDLSKCTSCQSLRMNKEEKPWVPNKGYLQFRGEVCKMAFQGVRQYILYAYSFSRKKKRGRPRINYSRQACKNIGCRFFLSWRELLRTVECHDQNTSQPAFGLNNMMMMMHNRRLLMVRRTKHLWECPMCYDVGSKYKK